MKSIKKLFALLLSVMTLFCLTACKLITIDGEDNGAASDYQGSGAIGLSVSTQNNPFFVTLVEGAKAAAEEKAAAGCGRGDRAVETAGYRLGRIAGYWRL